MRLFIHVQDFTDEIVRDEVIRPSHLTDVEYAEHALATAEEIYQPRYPGRYQIVRVIDEDRTDVDCSGEVDDPTDYEAA